MSITLTPAGVGARATTLTATAGAASDTQALAATGVVPSAVQLVSIAGGGMMVSFGNKAVLSETGIDVVIKNADTAQTIAAPTFTLSDTTNFRVDTNPGVGGMAADCFDEIADGGGLEGGEQCTVRVFFRPQSLPAVQRRGAQHVRHPDRGRGQHQPHPDGSGQRGLRPEHQPGDCIPTAAWR